MENDVFGALANIEDDLKKQLEAESGVQPTADVSNEPQKEDDTSVSDDVVEDEHPDDDHPNEEVKGDDRKKNSAWAKMRTEQKELRERLEAEAKEKQELRERLARLEGRNESMSPKPKDDGADNEPDKDLYPEDHIAWRQRQLDKRQSEMDQRLSRFEQESNVQRAQRAVEQLEHQFKSTNTKEDYDGAVKFLVEREASIKKLMNPNLTDAQIKGQIELEKMQLFATLHAQGKNPAQVIYETAKIQGFSSQKSDGAQQDGVQRKVDLQRVADNQRRATNLIGGSPASPNNSSKMSAEQILGLSMQEQAKLYAKNPRVFEESVS